MARGLGRRLIAGTGAMEGILKSSHFRDLGNLMLAFTMLWGYTAFSQFLLIWYGPTICESPFPCVPVPNCR